VGITSVLPNTPGPSALAIVAMVALALVLMVRIVARVRATEACRPEYTLGLIVTTVVLAAAFAVAAYSGIIDAGMPLGNLLALVGGCVVGGFTTATMINLFRSPGRLFASRLPLGMVALFALTMYVAIISFSQSATANGGGSAGGSVWWNVYKGALMFADLLTIILAVYVAILLVAGLFMVPINAYRRRRAARTATATP
jgi:hypothetical protein